MAASGTPASIVMRPMTIGDLPEVMAIERASYATPWEEAAYRQEFGNERAFLDVVTYASRIIGYSAMWHFVDEVHLGTLVSHPAVRRKGIGELLLVNVIARSITLGAGSVTLEVRASNHPARALYEKYEFAEVGYRKNYYRDHEDALLMTNSNLDDVAFQQRFEHQQQLLVQQLASFSVFPSTK